jgi:hypothetical protein
MQLSRSQTLIIQIHATIVIQTIKYSKTESCNAKSSQVLRFYCGEEKYS